MLSEGKIGKYRYEVHETLTRGGKRIDFFDCVPMTVIVEVAEKEFGLSKNDLCNQLQFSGHVTHFVENTLTVTLI
jgi:hypothetical protein